MFCIFKFDVAMTVTFLTEFKQEINRHLYTNVFIKDSNMEVHCLSIHPYNLNTQTYFVIKTLNYMIVTSQ